jgi:hypothetical protein
MKKLQPDLNFTLVNGIVVHNETGNRESSKKDDITDILLKVVFITP